MNRIIPTEISPESLEEFKNLFLKNYKYELSDEQATEQGLKLLRLLTLLIENSHNE